MPRWLWLTIVLFISAVSVVRSLSWNDLEYDEAEQLTLVQSLQWYYFYQPPLYTWLLWPLVKIFGPTVYPLIIIRSLLFPAIFLVMYRIAIRVCGHESLAGLVSISVILVPEIFHGLMGMWPHTTLMVFFCLCLLLIVLRLRERKDWLNYALLGICAGLGLLSKYNFLHFAGALAFAVLLSPGWRSILFDKKIILALILGSIIILPHAYEMYRNLDEVRYGMVRYTLEKQTQFSGWAASFKHIATNLFQNLTRSNGFLLLPLLLLFIPAWSVTRRDDDGPVAGFRSLIVKLYVVAALLLAFAMIIGGIHHIRQHWLTIFAMLLPLLFVSRVDPAKLQRWQWRSYRWLIALVLGGLVGWRAGLVYFKGENGCLSPYSFLHNRQAQQMRSSSWDQSFAVTDSAHAAGFLRMHFPQAQVYCIYMPSLPFAWTEGQPLLLVGWSEQANHYRKRMMNYFEQHNINPEAWKSPPLVTEFNNKPGAVKVLSKIIPE